MQLPSNVMKRIYCHKLVLLVILISSIFYTRAQNNIATDSLIQKLKICSNDSVKVTYLNELSWLNRISKSDSALKFANEAKSIAERIGFKSGIATSLNRIGEIERIQDNYNQAITTFNKALQIEKEINNTYGIARACGQLTLLYTNVGQTEKAFIVGQTTIKLYKELNNLPALANAYDRLAVLYEYQAKFDSALNLAYSGLEIRKQLKDTANFIYSYMNLANLYLKLQNNIKSLEFNSKAIELATKFNDNVNLSRVFTNISLVYSNQKQYHTAIDYNYKSIEIKQSLKQNKSVDTNYDNLGYCYYCLGEYNKAIQFYTKSIELKEEIGKKEGLSTAYINIGNLFFSTKKYDKALFYYKKGLANSETNSNKLITLELYQNIYKSYSITGQLENAVSFNDKYLTLRDSLDATYRNAMNLKENYQDEQRKGQLLEKDNLINEIKIKRKNIMIMSLLGGMILLILLFFTFLRSYRLKQRTLLAEKNYKINEQKIKELLKDQELKSMSAMLEGQEGERKRIAQDLHDRLGSMLSMVKLHFKSVEENIQALRENNMVMYSKANNLLDEACEEVRKIANDLISGVLNKFGLIPALNNLKESIEATGQLKIEVFNFGFDENRLEYNIEINLYRIIQELISNILKHSKASEVSIQLLKKEKRLNIVVEDNGIGFDVNQIKNKKGIGLRNIESRVDTLNGELNIDTGKGAGTTITIEIPIN
ncbi:MAG: tetratricopeptide repeat protein [Bacteroidales bacterium]|nr:MAG: tetratricopeptide repeat protein [Bacteroidales bacterium]